MEAILVIKQNTYLNDKGPAIKEFHYVEILGNKKYPRKQV